MPDRPRNVSLEKAASSSPQSDPKLPWEVSFSGKPSLGRVESTTHQPSAAHFAKAGKIDVLSKITKIRQEFENLHRGNDELQQQAIKLGKERTELKQRIAQLETQIQAMRQQVQKSRGIQDRLCAQITQLESRLRTTQSEKKELKAVLEEAQASMDEIRVALNWEDPVPKK